MIITIKFFAILRDIAGVSEITHECTAGVTVAQVSTHLRGKNPAMNPYLSKIAYAVNEQFVPSDTELHDGDVLALIPPVSGG